MATKYVIVEVSRRGNPIAVVTENDYNKVSGRPHELPRYFWDINPSRDTVFKMSASTARKIIKVYRENTESGSVLHPPRGNRLMLMSASEWNRFAKELGIGVGE